MDERMPRVVQDGRIREILGQHLTYMEAIVESREISIEDRRPDTSTRELKRCVAVLVWEEPDGTERTEVVGNEGDTNLHLKGLLHDGIYLLAHADEEGFALQ